MEIIRRAFGPAFRSLRATGPIKCRVDLDRIEVSRIELQLIPLQERIKDARPRSGAGVGRIAPATRADAEDSRIIGTFAEEIARGRISLRRFLSGGPQRCGRRGLSRLVKNHQCNKGHDHDDIGYNNKKSEIIHSFKIVLILCQTHK